MKKSCFFLVILMMMPVIPSFAQRIIDSSWSLAIEEKGNYTMMYGFTDFSVSFGMGVFLSEQDTVFMFNVKIKNTCRVPTKSDHNLKIKLFKGGKMKLTEYIYSDAKERTTYTAHSNYTTKTAYTTIRSAYGPSTTISTDFKLYTPGEGDLVTYVIEPYEAVYRYILTEEDLHKFLNGGIRKFWMSHASIYTDHVPLTIKWADDRMAKALVRHYNSLLEAIDAQNE